MGGGGAFRVIFYPLKTRNCTEKYAVATYYSINVSGVGRRGATYQPLRGSHWFSSCVVSSSPDGREQELVQ
jgi:hypothetical protein